MKDSKEHIRVTHIVVHGTCNDGTPYAQGSLITPAGTPVVLKPGDTLKIDYKLNFEDINDDQKNN